MKAYINGIKYYLPKEVLSNKDISEAHPEWSVDKISSKTGIYSRHISQSDEYVSDMAISALNLLIEERPILKDKIDFILLCTQSPDYSLPTTACMVQHRVGLNKTCGALDFNLGCSGYVYGLGLAKGLVNTGQAKNVVLITSEAYTKLIHHSDKSNKTIFGDAATVSLITSEPDENYFECEILDFEYGTDGNGYNNLIVKNSGARHKDQKNKDVITEDGIFVSNDDFLYMNGGEIFNFTAFQVPSLIKNTLQKNKLLLEDIHMFIFHQANAYMLDFIRKRCNIDKDHFFVSMDDVGNTVSSSIPIALSRYLDGFKSNDDQNLLLAGFGVGLSMGGCVLKLNKNIRNENQ